MIVTQGDLWPTDVRCSPVKIYTCIILSYLIEDKFRYTYIQNEKITIWICSILFGSLTSGMAHCINDVNNKIKSILKNQ